MMKKITVFVLFIFLILCSCQKETIEDSNNRLDDIIKEPIIEQPDDTEDEENSNNNDSEEKDPNDYVYNDDIDWGPLS